MLLCIEGHSSEAMSSESYYSSTSDTDADSEDEDGNPELEQLVATLDSIMHENAHQEVIISEAACCNFSL